jgi:2-polyprenyl-6-methoxyphenol hydroxylase-like FAD-dependent oxidoreductase
MAGGSVLIVGGGIAGMSAAISLQRAGLPVEIAETDPHWRSSGAGLTINAPSLRAFAALGILEDVKREGHCHGGTRFCDAQGNVISEPPVNQMSPDIPTGAGILRPVLHTILADATRASGATVHLGVSVTAIAQTADRVRVTFAGRPSAEYDAVVVADGLHSTIRKAIFPCAPEPLFNGQGCWRAVFPRDRNIETGTVFVGLDHRAGLNPVSNEEMYLFLLQSVPDNRRMKETQWPQLLAAELAEFGGILGRLRENLGPDSRINYRPLENLLLARPWYQGRVLLIGDAAHATTPHLAYGAGLAVEDGLVLGELAKAGVALHDVFERFTERRFERCRMVVEGSTRLGELELQGAPAHEHRAAFAQVTEYLWQPI